MTLPHTTVSNPPVDRTAASVHEDSMTDDLPVCTQSGIATHWLFGMAINSLTWEELFEAVDKHLASDRRGFVVTPNADHVCMYHRNPELRDAYRKAWLVVPDGMPLMWAGRLVGKPFKEKLSGSDMVYLLTEHAAKQGHRVFFLGAADGVAAETAKLLEEMYPGLQIAGTYSPPPGFESDAEHNAKIVDIIRKSRADICYVALGGPKQEIWCSQYADLPGMPICIGVGAGLDFVCGVQRRAPKWMQNAGLEWVYRLCWQPRRLGRRYLIQDTLFIWIFGRELWQRFTRRQTK